MDQPCLVILNGGRDLLLAVKESFKGGLPFDLADIALHGLLGVVLCLPVRMRDGQAVLNRVAGGVIIFRVIDLLVHNSLQARILRGEDLEAAAEQEVRSLGVRIPELFLERLCNLVDELVRIVRIGRCIAADGQIHVLDAGIDVVGQRFLLLLLGNIALLVHFL